MTTVPTSRYTGKLPPRAAAALRLPVLDCGTCHDPRTCTCTSPAIQPAATLAAAQYLAASGLDGAFAVAELRAAYAYADTDAQRRILTKLAEVPK